MRGVQNEAGAASGVAALDDHPGLGIVAVPADCVFGTEVIKVGSPSALPPMVCVPTWIPGIHPTRPLELPVRLVIACPAKSPWNVRV